MEFSSNGEKFVTLEAFEASPSSEAVLAAEGALLWDFPGRAVEIPYNEFVKASDSLALFLDQANSQTLSDLTARASKARVSVVEARDTADPALITQMLLPLFEAVGSTADIDRFRKRIRDDVSHDRAEFPWRRSSLWLILRVATQRQLSLSQGQEDGRACYKFLMCTLFAQFLEDCASDLTPELTMMIQAKLCHRIAKLEIEKTQCSTASSIYESMFDSLGPAFESVIANVSHQMESVWATFKKSITKSIPLLPCRADTSATRLSLPNSGKYLDDLLALSRMPQVNNSSQPPSADDIKSQRTPFVTKIFKLVEFETKIKNLDKLTPRSSQACEARCVTFAATINDYFALIGTELDDNPEQMSLVILNLFDLWIALDQCAIQACPLLSEYHPIFHPGLLDVLQLASISQMQRLRRIQEYLRTRCQNCRYATQTILSEINKKSFAVCYVRDSKMLSSAASMRELLRRIQEASESSRERKSSEWKAMRQKYDTLNNEIASLTCVCTTDSNGNRKRCKRCLGLRQRKKFKIKVHEDFLPVCTTHQAAVVFELQIPNFLAAYRNATWKIFKLAHPSKHVGEPPVLLLRNYSQLTQYLTSKNQGISMASAKKSFLQTHYKEIPITVKLADVLLPLGLSFHFYDAQSGIWAKDLDKPLTFQHLCGIHIPQSLRDSIFPVSEHPMVSETSVSSYEIIANDTRCPPQTSVHEFSAFQRLLSGKSLSLRWFTMVSLLFSCFVSAFGVVLGRRAMTALSP